MFEKVYKIVKKIPRGKVVTYGLVANAIGTRDSRKVGWALHANRSSDVPCHRVVAKDGRLATNYAFGGSEIQRKLLESEGITFDKNGKVRLDRHLLDFQIEV